MRVTDCICLIDRHVHVLLRYKAVKILTNIDIFLPIMISYAGKHEYSIEALTESPLDRRRRRKCMRLITVYVKLSGKQT